MTHADADMNEAPPEVLAIDDSIAVLRLLHAKLRTEHVAIRMCESGREALRLVVEHRPALILLDLEMPEMDGYEVLRALKDAPETLNIPVIVLSGLRGSQDKVAAFDLGAIDYITKPFESAELRARVRSALRLHRLMTMLEQQARLDGLTGLWNRSYFDEQWPANVTQAERHGRPLSLAMLDIDHFKQLNDTYGHPAGDEALQRIGALIRDAGRAGDIPCRYGGEEFVLIMPDTEPADAVALCERIIDRLRAMHWPAHPDRSITASVGVAGTRAAGGIEADNWVSEADGTLYCAKREGRDRVLVTELDSPGPRLAEAG